MAVTYTLTMINANKGIYEQIKNVQSHTHADVPYYDGSTYRNTIDVSYLGTGIPSNSAISVTAPFHFPDVSDDIVDALFTASGGSSGVAIPPRKIQKTRTQWQITCLASDNSTTFILYFWFDEWEIGGDQTPVFF